MVDVLITFVFKFLQGISNVFGWLTSPFITYDNLPLGFMILDRLGVNISWMYTLTPLELVTGSLVTFLGTILLIKFVGLILDAIPIF